MYTVYLHTCNITNKSYIGYTKFTMNERFHKHYTNACSGIDTHFYRAIRKHGIDSFESQVLYTTPSKQVAIEKEIIFIEKYKTFTEGYNSTTGGTGGDVYSGFSDEKLKEWTEHRKELSAGENNAMHCGKSDDDIIKFVTNIVKNNNGVWNSRLIQRACKDNGYPQSYSKCRFSGGGVHKLREIVSETLLEEYNIQLTMIMNTKTQSHKDALRKANIGNRWYTNTQTGEQILTKEKLKGPLWVRGRKII